MEVSLPRTDPVLGALPEDLALFAYARGTGDFVRLTEVDEKGDGAGDGLKAKLDALKDAAAKAVCGGLDIIGVNVKSAGESVAKGRTDSAPASGAEPGENARGYGFDAST